MVFTYRYTVDNGRKCLMGKTRVTSLGEGGK